MKVKLKYGTYVDSADSKLIDAIEFASAVPGYADGVRWLLDHGFEVDFTHPNPKTWNGWVRYDGSSLPVCVRWRRLKEPEERQYWFVCIGAVNAISERVEAAVAQAVKEARERAVEAQAKMSDAKAGEAFYRDYIQDNAAFESMPHKCWDYIKDHKLEVMKRSYLAHGDTWEGVERAVRNILRENCMDGDSW